MAVELATAYVNLVASARGISAGIGKELNAPLVRAGRDAGDKSSKEFSHRFSFGLKRIGQIASGVIIAHAARVGIRAITRELGSLVSEARDAAKIGRLTGAVLKSTGGAANVSAGQVGALADRLSALTGVDDEVIQSGENVLLTFTDIRNQVGKGNDIFNQATQAALNMSAALGGDLQSNVIQLGKALQDPVKGLTALKRVGVNTDQLKDKVELLVAAGDKLGAQKVILKELAVEFGGAAAAAADPLERLKVIIGNFKETLGTALLPTINSVATALGTVLPGIATTFAPLLSQLVGGIGGLLKTVSQPLRGLVSELVPALSATFKALGPVLSPIAHIVGELGSSFLMIVQAMLPLLPAVGKLIGAFAPLGEAIGTVLVRAVQTLVPLLMPLIDTITNVATAFIGTSDKAGPLAQVVLIIGKAFQEFGKLLLPIIPLIGQLAGDLVAGLAPVLPDLAKAFGQLFLALAPVVPELAKLAIVLLRDIGVPTIVALAQSFAVLATAITPLVASLARMKPLVVGLGLAFVGFKAISTFTTALTFSRAVVRAAAFDLNRLRTSLIAQKAAAFAAAVGTKLLAAAQWLLNIAMDANPVVLIVLAIAALAAGIFIAYKKFKPFRDIVDAVGRALAGVFEFVKKNWKLVLGLLIAPFIVGPILIFKKFGPTLLKLLGKVPALLGKVGIAIMKGLLQGLKIGLIAVGVLFIGIPILLAAYLVKAIFLLDKKGVEIIAALVRGFVSALPTIASFFLGLPAKIAGFIRGAGTFLVSKGVEIVKGLIVGFVKMEIAIAKFWIGVPARIIAALGVVVNTLIPKGIELVGGFLIGLVRAFVDVIRFFVALPGRIVRTLVNLGTALVPAGIQIIGGFLVGLFTNAHNVFDFFTHLPAQMVDALGDVGRILYDAGRAIIGGLIDGIKSMFSAIGDAVGSVAGFITDHFPNSPIAKTGPLRARTPQSWGRSIGEGLQEGLNEAVPKLRQTLDIFAGASLPKSGSFTPRLIPVKAIAATSPAATVNATAGNGRQPIVHIEKLYARDDEDVARVIAAQQRRQYLLSTL